MRENPSVNRCLTDKAIDHIDHALGRPTFPLRESYRNHFATSVGSSEEAEFMASLNWRRIGRQGDMVFFEVTPTGRGTLAGWLAREAEPWRAFSISYQGYVWTVPARTAGKARYSAYLDISDSISELTFGDFCAEAKCRVAA